MKGDFHARICEGLWVKLPRSTRCVRLSGVWGANHLKLRRSQGRVVSVEKRRNQIRQVRSTEDECKQTSDEASRTLRRCQNQGSYGVLG